MKYRRANQAGQAVVEYLLILVVAIGIAATIATGFRKSILGLWVAFAKDISAACPGCPPDPGVHLQ